MKSMMVLAAVTLFGTAPVLEHSGQDWNFNTRVRDGEVLTSCDQIDVTVRGAELARGEEAASVPAAADGLAVTGFVNGGLYVRGSGGAEYEVKLCKFAAGRTASDAAATLEHVKLAVNGGVVAVNGPSERRDWNAHLIVLAPQDARMKLETRNGPLSIHGVSGNVHARATNGPVSVRGSSGEIRIDAQNGPVDVSETSGAVHAVASNGPLSINLSGQAWDGSGLDARASNGPLTLRMPAGYQSGVLVEMSRHSPLNCRAAICSDAVRLGGDDGGTLRIGSADAQVRVSAKNGPVSITSSRE
jgi:hypothetical protein